MLIWNARTTPEELRNLLETLGEEYPLKEGAEAELSFESAPVGTLKVSRSGKCFLVSYEPGKIASAARGIGFALAGIEISERCSFNTLGLLFDTSRGSVFTVEGFKRRLRRMALFGYNMAMIYTKDMYRLPDEPYFGYMRGAYTLEELREIDSYAKKLGVEMVASIQALGHMEPVLRWRAYGKVRDTDNVMLVDEPAAMELIGKILDFWSEAFTSRRIHLGMDETHDLGRGRFMDLHGFESPFDLYNRHLKRVLECCGKHAFDPIIWSDMYFRFANVNQDYYDLAAEVPENVRRAIPEKVRLSYWDYYHRNAPFYEKMLARTRALNGSSPFMASGIWTWFSLWCDFELTEGTVSPCVDACEKSDVKELIFTLWADDGSYCAFDSSLPAEAWCAARVRHSDPEKIAPLCRAVLGSDGTFERLASKMEFTFESPTDAYAKVRSPQLLWDDPLYGIARRELPFMKPELFETLLSHYEKLACDLAVYRGKKEYPLAEHAWNIVNVIERKLKLRRALESGYGKRDFSVLGRLRSTEIPELVSAVDELQKTFRAQWLAHFKPYGLELMQIRLAGLQERCRELARVLKSLEEGEISSIPELEEQSGGSGFIDSRYRMIATGSWYI